MSVCDASLGGPNLIETELRCETDEGWEIMQRIPLLRREVVGVASKCVPGDLTNSDVMRTGSIG